MRWLCVLAALPGVMKSLAAPSSDRGVAQTLCGKDIEDCRMFKGVIMKMGSQEEAVEVEALMNATIFTLSESHVAQAYLYSSSSAKLVLVAHMATGPTRIVAVSEAKDLFWQAEHNSLGFVEKADSNTQTWQELQLCLGPGTYSLAVTANENASTASTFELYAKKVSKLIGCDSQSSSLGENQDSYTVGQVIPSQWGAMPAELSTVYSNSFSSSGLPTSFSENRFGPTESDHSQQSATSPAPRANQISNTQAPLQTNPSPDIPQPINDKESDTLSVPQPSFLSFWGQDGQAANEQQEKVAQPIADALENANTFGAGGLAGTFEGSSSDDSVVPDGASGTAPSKEDGSPYEDIGFLTVVTQLLRANQSSQAQALVQSRIALLVSRIAPPASTGHDSDIDLPGQAGQLRQEPPPTEVLPPSNVSRHLIGDLDQDKSRLTNQEHVHLKAANVTQPKRTSHTSVSKNSTSQPLARKQKVALLQAQPLQADLPTANKEQDLAQTRSAVDQDTSLDAEDVSNTAMSPVKADTPAWVLIGLASLFVVVLVSGLLMLYVVMLRERKEKEKKTAVFTTTKGPQKPALRPKSGSSRLLANRTLTSHRPPPDVKVEDYNMGIVFGTADTGLADQSAAPSVERV